MFAEPQLAVLVLLAALVLLLLCSVSVFLLLQEVKAQAETDDNIIQMILDLKDEVGEADEDTEYVAIEGAVWTAPLPVSDGVHILLQNQEAVIDVIHELLEGINDRDADQILARFNARLKEMP